MKSIIVNIFYDIMINYYKFRLYLGSIILNRRLMKIKRLQKQVEISKERLNER